MRRGEAASEGAARGRRRACLIDSTVARRGEKQKKNNKSPPWRSFEAKER